ncbi:MAG: hypothetical protein KF757_06010 [Phycisphaeraceae bacterium]|nr:hypothetical protein [Phycisphaeraceae bacterium]MCW5763728.1 hypothetical protein [Phycisphaeraceae bacterium]
MTSQEHTPLRSLFGPFDPGWLYLLAGLGLLSASALIPAQKDLADARWRRDTALQLEQHRLDRLERYHAYRDSLKQGDPNLTQSLAASQLGLVPSGQTPLTSASMPALRHASIFHELEPPPIEVVTPTSRVSMLQRLVTARDSRLWIIAAAAICLLFGALPRSGSQADDA